MEAAQALEGKFSAEGLASMAGKEGSAEMALAKSLADRIEEGDAARHWAKVGAAVSNAVRDIGFDEDIPAFDHRPECRRRRFRLRLRSPSPG